MDDNTIEALRQVLQDMTLAIELISSGERSGAALIHFIEEMLKTIESWAVKYNVFLDDGSLALNPAQGSHPNSKPNLHSSSYPQVQQAIGSLDVDQDVNGSLDMADPSTRQNSVEGERVQQPMSFNQEVVTWNAEEGGTESVGQQNKPSQTGHNLGTAASLARRVSRKTRSQTAAMHADVASTHDGGGKMLSPHSEDSLKPQEAVSGDEPDGSKGDVIESPSWLPEGWITEAKTRGSGASKDKVYIDPTTNRHFRSKKDVLAFLGTTKRKRGRPRKTEFLKNNSPSHASDTVPAGNVHDLGVGPSPELQSPSNASPSNNISDEVTAAASAVGVDTAKRKRGRPRKVDSLKNLPQTKDESGEHTIAPSQDIAKLESGVNSNIGSEAPSSVSLPAINETQPLAASSSMPSSSSIPLPHQSGQPSEWLVYESLASLPFPMFEHLRFVENNANKLMTNNSSPTLWPWMLGNSEGLKKPFTDIKANESKPVEESKQVETAPISSTGEMQASDAVPKRPKKAARKNAS